MGWLGLAVKRLFTAISLDQVGSFPTLILVSGWSTSGRLVQSIGMATRISWPWMRTWHGKSIASCPEQRSPVGHVTNHPDWRTTDQVPAWPPEVGWRTSSGLGNRKRRRLGRVLPRFGAGDWPLGDIAEPEVVWQLD